VNVIITSTLSEQCFDFFVWSCFESFLCVLGQLNLLSKFPYRNLLTWTFFVCQNMRYTEVLDESKISFEKFNEKALVSYTRYVFSFR